MKLYSQSNVTAVDWFSSENQFVGKIAKSHVGLVNRR